MRKIVNVKNQIGSIVKMKEETKEELRNIIHFMKMNGVKALKIDNMEIGLE